MVLLLPLALLSTALARGPEPPQVVLITDEFKWRADHPQKYVWLSPPDQPEKAWDRRWVLLPLTGMAAWVSLDRWGSSEEVMPWASYFDPPNSLIFPASIELVDTANNHVFSHVSIGIFAGNCWLATTRRLR
jgi:hypothetical protein